MQGISRTCFWWERTSVHHLQRVELGSSAEHRALKRSVGSGVLHPGVEGQEEGMEDWKGGLFPI